MFFTRIVRYFTVPSESNDVVLRPQVDQSKPDYIAYLILLLSITGCIGFVVDWSKIGGK